MDDDIEGKKKKSAMAKNPFGYILSDGFKYLETLFFTTDHANPSAFRNSITQTYTKLLGALGGSDIDANMDMIVERMLDLLRHNTRSNTNERDTNASAAAALTEAHECVYTVLYTFGSTLREIQQQRMTELLSSALKDKRADEHTLSVVLSEMRCLVAKIGSASADMQEWLTPLVTNLLAHPAPSVRFDAVLCLRTLGAALPSQLASLIRTCLTEIATHSEGLLIDAASTPTQQQQQQQQSLTVTLREIGKHAAALRGYGIALAALISNVDSAPLSVPNSLLRVAFSAAKALLALPPHTDSAAQDARVTAAWAIIAALTSSHKACDTVYAVLKESIIPSVSSALAGTPYQKQRKPKDIDAFLRGKLGALWVIDAALSNCDTTNNLNSSSSTSGNINTSGKPPTSSSKGSILVTSVLGNLKSLAIELDDLVTACNSSIPEATQNGVFMTSAALLRVFAKLPSKDMLASCHSALYGLSKTLVRDTRAASTLLDKMLNKADDALSFWADTRNNSGSDAGKEAGMRCPDYSIVWHPASKAEVDEGEVTTSLWCGPRAQAVNEAIAVFSQLFSLQTEKKQLEMIRDLAASQSGPEKSPVRRRNTLVAAAAIVRELGGTAHLAEERGHVTKALIEQLNRFLADSDMALLRGAAESLGLLCRVAGDGYTAAVVRTLTNLCKEATTTAHARAGYSLALGCIQRAVGIRSSRYLEGTLGTLSEALKDGSAQLQAVALHAFCLAVDSAPSFKPQKTVALVYQLLQSARHDSPMALRGIGDVINSLVGIVGPELQRGARLMHIANIVNECLRSYPHPLVQLESVRFYQRLIVFAPQAVVVQEIVPLVRAQMASQWAAVRHDAVTCLRQLVQGPWASQLGVGHLAIATRLFEMLDNESDAGLLKEGELVLATLLEKARPQDATQWLATLCEIVLTTHSTSKSDDGLMSSSSSMSGRGRGGGGGDDDDMDDDEDDEEEEEGNSFTTGKRQRSYDDEVADGAENGVNAGSNGSSGERHEDLSAAADAAASGAGKPQNELVPRWRTKVFAIKCIHRLLEIIHAKLPETAAHFDSILAGPAPVESGGGGSDSSGGDGEGVGKATTNSPYIVHMIALLVKVVFFASTSTVDPLRPAGVRLMKDIVVYFGASEDVMARGHKLLELYEAQFASALTRAFSLDAPPETITVACETLAFFILNEISTASSVPRLTLLLAGFVPTLRKIYFPQYSEWAVTQVQTAIVAGLAKLCLMRPGISPAIRKAINDGLAPHTDGIKSLFVDYVRDYTALSTSSTLGGAADSIAASSEYQATFFVPHDSVDALQLMEKDWRLVLDALCHVLETSPALSAQDHALVLAIALNALQKDSSAFDALSALVHRDYFAQETLGAAKACEFVLRVIAFERDHPENVKPLALAKFAAKLALAIPENYCCEGAPTDLAKRCELVKLATLLAVRDPPEVKDNADNTFSTQLQLAALALVSLGKIELPDPAEMATHVGTLLRACLCWAAACPVRDALHIQELSKAVVALVGRRGGPKAPWVTALVEAAFAECLRITGARCGTPLFGTERACTSLAVFDALIVIACTLRTGGADEVGFSDSTVAGLRCALASPCHHARLAALETFRSIVQLATTAPNVVAAATQLLYELGPQLSQMAATFAKSENKDVTGDNGNSERVGEMQEVVKVLILAHVLSQNKAASIAAVIPPLVVLLAPAAAEGSAANAVHEVAFQAVMQLATKFGNDFRGYVGSLGAEQRAHIELMMRQSAETAAARAKAKADREAAAAAAAAAQTRQGGHGRLKPLSLDLSKYKK